VNNDDFVAEPIENDSGQGTVSRIPDELKGLNWGACLLTFIWGVPMRVPHAWFTLVPFVGELMRIVLLFKGNEWAWQGRKWDSPDQFRKTQSKWNRLSIVLTILMFVISLFVANKMVDLILTSPYMGEYMMEYQRFIFRLLDSTR